MIKLQNINITLYRGKKWINIGTSAQTDKAYTLSYVVLLFAENKTQIP